MDIHFELVLYAIVAFVLIGVFLAGMILLTKAKLVSHKSCEIGINEDPSLKVLHRAGSPLLQVLTGKGIPIPSPCGGKATCKQCRVKVVKGNTEPLQTEVDTFTKKQLKEGWRLSCQCKIAGDMQIEVDKHSLSVKSWEGVVLRNDNVATFIKELVVEVPDDVPYKSGGYLQFHVPPFKTNSDEWKATIDSKFWPDWEKFSLFGHSIDYSHHSDEIIRAYSMASFPAEGKKLIFNVRIATPPFKAGKIEASVPWGICSSYTFSLKPGDKVKLSGPYGESFMIQDDRELVFLIGGAGSSFGRSHILHLFHTEKTKRKVTLWYGARSLRENIYEAEFRELEKQFSNFSYRLVLSEPLPEDFEKGWPKNDPTKTNFLFKAFWEGQLKKMEYPEESLYYVCGPPMHNKSIMKLLDDYGVPRANIVLDDFGS